MAKKINDLAVVIGEYRDQQSGQDKKRWQNIGIEMETDDGGRFILLDPLINLAAIPRGVGKDSIMVSKFSVDGRNQNNGQQQQHDQHQHNQWNWPHNNQPMTPPEVSR